MAKIKDHPKPAEHRHRPLFGTLGARIQFLLVMTVFSLTAVAIYEFREFHQAQRADALAASRRQAAAATAAAADTAEHVRRVLTGLGDAVVDSGGGAMDCERLVVEASFQGDFEDIGVAAPHGTVLCDSKIEPKMTDVSGQSYFQRALGTGLYAAGDAIAADRGKLMGFAYPARGANGDTVAVAFAVIGTDVLAGGLYPGSGYIAGIADARGRDIVRLDSEGNPATANSAPELTAAMLADKDGTADIYDTDGVERIYSFRSSSGQATGRLYFYAGAPARTLFAETDRAVWRIAIVGLFLAALILWLMLTIGDLLVTRRTRRLAHTMLDIVDGDAAPDSLPGGLGELDGLIVLFARLAQELDKAKKTTEEKIRSRTSVLEYSKGITELEKARTDALLASISYGVVATDEAGRVSFFNDRAKEAMWWNPAKANGVPIHSVFQLEDEKENVIAQADWPTRRALENGESVVTPAPTKPFFIRRQDKSKFPVKMTITPVTLNGANAGCMVIFRNITNEVEFDRRKSEFISIASHQLRSPMAAMKWMSFMLRGGDFGALNPKQQEWSDKIYKTSETLVELVNELLNISRLETGVKIHPRENDTDDFLDDVMVKNEPMLLEKKQKYSFARRDLPKLVFDPLMIGEVLKNLISNASKYSPVGGQVEITAMPSETEVRFAIKDQGLGIPKADHKKLFSKFFRAANVIKDQIQGTGLGLYYCKSAVEVHGGRIGFDSEEGQGSTFWFTLPVKSPLTPEAAETAPPAK